ncbi:hypothetical protein [Nocardioides sp. W7]|uniref:hypothetical protein n=1 Tax=Nocardioides sp. W7 TaxID=2931390 RepID=UPI001FCFD19A|nr:hypothetical protein [Nocardioides sp. W7]
MDPLHIIAGSQGFFTRQHALRAGFDDREIAAQVRQRQWTRFRRGYYAITPIWDSLDPRERHLVRARAVLDSLGAAVALSHVSAVLAHGVVDWGLDLDRVHVTRLDGGAGRVEGDVVHHEGVCIDGDVVEVDGLLVVRPERCVLEAGSMATPEVALALFDDALRLGLFDHETLIECHQLLQFWPRMRRLHVPVHMADGRSGSVGESRGRWFFRAEGVPAPALQFEVVDETGSLIATCDWGWPGHGLLGEFDGRLKYGRLLAPGQEPGDVVFAEKRREDLVREITGFRMIRIVWSDYDRPRLLGKRVISALRLAG